MHARASHREGLRFIHEDADVVVVDKPAGLPSIAPEGSRGRSAYSLVTARLEKSNPKARAAVVHRLDRDTSGVMIFATNARAKKTLMDGWSEMVEDRRYVALVEGELANDSGSIESWIAEAGPSRMRIAEPGERGALKARLSWTVLGQGRGLTLLEIALETGRKHQIRVQLASIGHPVAGDERYGARSVPMGRLMLHAKAIAFRHPRNGELMSFESPIPPEFEQALAEQSPDRGKPRGSGHAIGEPRRGKAGSPRAGKRQR